MATRILIGLQVWIVLFVGCCAVKPGPGTGGSGGGDGGSSGTMSTGGSGGGACPCNCPEGPPEGLQVSAFCGDPANECTGPEQCPPCCLGPGIPGSDGPVIGFCHNLECVFPS